MYVQCVYIFMCEFKADTILCSDDRYYTQYISWFHRKCDGSRGSWHRCFADLMELVKNRHFFTKFGKMKYVQRTSFTTFGCYMQPSARKALWLYYANLTCMHGRVLACEWFLKGGKKYISSKMALSGFEISNNQQPGRPVSEGEIKTPPPVVWMYLFVTLS